MNDDQPTTQAIRTFTSKFDRAFCALADSLTAAFCTPETKPGDRAVNLRKRHIAALNSLWGFFEVIGQRNIARMFFELAVMLEDLNRGIVHPTLKAATQKGRQDRFDIWLARDSAARAVDLLIRSGKDISEAAVFAASGYPDLNRLKRDPGDNLTAAITSWVRRLQEGSVTNEISRKMFAENTRLVDAMIEHAGGAPSEGLQRAAEVFLENAAAQARAIIIEGEISATPTSVDLGGE